MIDEADFASPRHAFAPCVKGTCREERRDSMLDAWFNLPVAAMFVALAAPYALITAAIWWLTFHSPLRKKVQTLTGVVAPFFGSVAILFALLTGFLANDVADRTRAATRALLGESDGLYAVQMLSLSAASDMSGIRDALRNYAASVIADEWPQMVDIGRAAKTEAAYGDLLREVSDPNIARDAGQAIHSALINAVSRIGSARSDRLALSADSTSQYKWITVFILAAITQIAIGLVHLDKPRAQLAALTVFSAAVVIALGLIALQEQPFAGVLQVSPAPIREFLDSVAAKS